MKLERVIRAVIMHTTIIVLSVLLGLVAYWLLESFWIGIAWAILFATKEITFFTKYGGLYGDKFHKPKRT